MNRRWWSGKNLGSEIKPVRVQPGGSLLTSGPGVGQGALLTIWGSATLVPEDALSSSSCFHRKASWCLGSSTDAGMFFPPRI